MLCNWDHINTVVVAGQLWSANISCVFKVVVDGISQVWLYTIFRVFRRRAYHVSSNAGVVSHLE